MLVSILLKKLWEEGGALQTLNLSISAISLFPNDLKIEKVTPIFKACDSSDISN